jgi:hypothetical protein
MTPGMSHEEIRAMLDWNLERVREIHERAVARKAAEQIALESAPSRVVTPTVAAAPAKPRIGPAMKRVLVYLAQQHEPVTCAAVYVFAGLDSGHSSTRMPLFRCEALGLVHVDRYRSNLYGVTITDAGREYLAAGRGRVRPTWDDAYRWEPGDGILDTIGSQQYQAQACPAPSGTRHSASNYSIRASMTRSFELSSIKMGVTYVT